MNANFRQRVEARLKAMGMTQRQLAEKLDVSEVTVSRWLSGERNPTVETLEQMANVLGTTTSYFFLKDEPSVPGSAPAKTEGQSSGISTGLKVTFGVILGLVITAVAAGLLTKDQKDRLVDALKKDDGETP